MIPEKISHFRILESLGRGGMGEVFLAHDTDLDRDVALKILPQEYVTDEDRLHRFLREAKAASALSHSNAAHIYEIGEAEGIHFIAMEYIQGETLAKKLSRRPMSSGEILHIAIQLADALDEAHAKGITHRDIKPANIMITLRNQVKLLDFGLAKIRKVEEIESASDLATVTRTQVGVAVGTLPYMSPEQVLAKPVDHRSDYFSLGVVLYEMTAGALPFKGDTGMETIDAILHADPAPASKANPGTPAQLESIISKLLAKDPANRYQTARAILGDLQQLAGKMEAAGHSTKWTATKYAGALMLFVIVLGLSYLTWSARQKASRVRWVNDTALPEISRLIDEEHYAQAVQLAEQAEHIVPRNPALAKLWPRMIEHISIDTDPPGAEIRRKPYKASDGEWQTLGQSPIHDITLPLGSFQWKFSKPGFRTAFYVTPNWFPPRSIGAMSITLDEERKAPAGMVRVPGGKVPWELSNIVALETVELDDFWMDQYEVTNKQFRNFVAKGGYRNQDYWKHRFIKDGKEISWEKAMAEFHDATGRLGPRNWEVGDYPDGRANDPVAGISWYEAAAYCESEGKSLPTVYHWVKAAGIPISQQIVPLSNFAGNGPAPAGTYHGMSPYGTFDMAGNVKEWCWNGSGGDKYFILGGAYDEPEYMFNDGDSRFPFDRSANNGIRCIKTAAKPFSGDALKPLNVQYRDFRNEAPVPDSVFQYFKSTYSYDRTDLQARVESTDEGQEFWIKQKVSFNAAYGNERVTAYLYLPRNSSPPYQAVIFFPSGAAEWEPSSDHIENLRMMARLEFIMKSGRALVFPIYQGTFERSIVGRHPTPTQRRDLYVQESKDLGRTIDYLETRRDVDQKKLAYLGISWGGSMGAIFPAIENRLKVAVLVGAGLENFKCLPDGERINFLPRVTIPVLMINGRYDHYYPVETNQNPMFRLLGTPEQDKRHAVYDGGHVVSQSIVIRETLDWLDRYLGPVTLH